MKLMFIHRSTPIFRVCAALLFLCGVIALNCAAQSASSAKADAASRASTTYQHGMSALQKGDLVSARADFEKVVRLAPSSPEGHNSLGWVLLAQGEIDSAIVHLRSAVKLNPDFALAHMNFSTALYRKGDLAAALREARRLCDCLQTIPRLITFWRARSIFPGISTALSASFGARSNWSRKGRNCTTISEPCWCRRLTRKGRPRSFPKRSGCNLISRTRTIILGWPSCRQAMATAQSLNSKPQSVCAPTTADTEATWARHICKWRISTLRLLNLRQRLSFPRRMQRCITIWDWRSS